MKTELSILIPTYNCCCTNLVQTLNEQALRLPNISYEIIVADDGSTEEGIMTANKQINAQPNCHYLMRPTNVGRAAIRNFLAKTARYRWLLFIDSSVHVDHDNFLRLYLSADSAAQVICGGVAVGTTGACDQHCLRYLYERHYAERHPLSRRQKQPYQSFRTTNFMVARDTLRALPFCEEIQTYGYEDVLWGKQLQQHHIPIVSIDNPVAYLRYDDNAVFMAKTEEALDTLATFRDQLKGYSALLLTAERMQHYGFASLFLTVFKRRYMVWRKRLCGQHPPVWLYNLYRLGYLLMRMKEITHPTNTSHSAASASKHPRQNPYPL